MLLAISSTVWLNGQWLQVHRHASAGTTLRKGCTASSSLASSTVEHGCSRPLSDSRMAQDRIVYVSTGTYIDTGRGKRFTVKGRKIHMGYKSHSNPWDR
jgi:hypothetical protein